MKSKTQTFGQLLLVILMVFMSSCSSSDDDSSTPDTPPPPPVGEDTLKGNYRGTWNSTTPTATFVDFLISVKINGENTNGNSTTLTGEFFATSSFTSCCGNANDGTIVINLDGNTITSFSFNDQIVDCTGNFSGSGEVNSEGDFIIDFTGNDCDGNHVGQIVLSK